MQKELDGFVRRGDTFVDNIPALVTKYGTKPWIIRFVLGYGLHHELPLIVKDIELEATTASQVQSMDATYKVVQHARIYVPMPLAPETLEGSVLPPTTATTAGNHTSKGGTFVSLLLSVCF